MITQFRSYKTILSYLIKSNARAFMDTEGQKLFSERLINISNYVPKEFQRKPRRIEEVARWKATEFRHFILVVNEIYQEILLLHIAYRLISTPNHYDDDINTASELLQTFGKLFGENSITFNVHNLLHLPKVYEKWTLLQHYLHTVMNIFCTQ